jgi:hypothetical protein
MTHRRLFLAGLFLTSLMAYAKENQYVLVAAPRPLDLRPPVNRATRRDVWFDYDNAILQQRYVLDLIGATTGRCKGAAADVPDELPLHVCAVARNADTTANPATPATLAEPPTFPGKDDYIILHVVNWNSASGSGLTVSKQNWYVYNTDPGWDYTAFTGTRIYGKKQLYLYTIHLNVPTGTTYQERYAVDEKYKTPAFLNHLVAIGQLFGIGSSGQGRLVVPDNWYAFRLDVKYIPSDLTITPTMVPDSASASAPASTPEPLQTQSPNPAPADSPKPDVSSLGPPTTVPVAGAPPIAAPTAPAAAPAVAAGTPLPAGDAGAATTKPAAAKSSGKNVTLDAKTFDNEGKYHIDFSVAVPITKITELNYVQTSNGVAPANVNKQKIFALIDIYPVAVDVKNTVLPKFPYFLAGAAIGSQPLKKVLFGIGWGPLFANFYAGLLLNTQAAPASWSCGDKLPAAPAAGTSLSNHSCPGFSFGLNLGVGAITDALKTKAKPAATTPAK